MDQRQAKQRRIDIISIVAVLLVVAVFWVFVAPRSRIYQTHKLEASAKRKMGEIRPPTGVDTLAVKTKHIGNLIIMAATYETNQKFATIKSHYMKEMRLLGFTFVKEEITPKQTSEHFCAAGYHVQVVASSTSLHPPFSTIYTLFLENRNDLKC
jgi:hypothetical protein